MRTPHEITRHMEIVRNNKAVYQKRADNPDNAGKFDYLVELRQSINECDWTLEQLQKELDATGYKPHNEVV